MLWLSPERVMWTAGGVEHALTGVASAAVDRRATRLAVERADLGPHVVFADAPEQRVTITIERSLDGSPEEEWTLAQALHPGAMGDLAVRSAPGAGDAGGRIARVMAVVLSVVHTLSGRRGAVQAIRLLAVSPDGVADPVQETDEHEEAPL